MMSINEALEKILIARYGEDVRQAIYDGIKACNDSKLGKDEKAKTAASADRLSDSITIKGNTKKTISTQMEAGSTLDLSALFSFGNVNSVNGNEPDEYGNVVVKTGNNIVDMIGKLIAANEIEDKIKNISLDVSLGLVDATYENTSLTNLMFNNDEKMLDIIELEADANISPINGSVFKISKDNYDWQSSTTKDYVWGKGEVVSSNVFIKYGSNTAKYSIDVKSAPSIDMSNSNNFVGLYIYIENGKAYVTSKLPKTVAFGLGNGSLVSINDIFPDENGNIQLTPSAIGALGSQDKAFSAGRADEIGKVTFQGFGVAETYTRFGNGSKVDLTKFIQPIINDKTIASDSIFSSKKIFDLLPVVKRENLICNLWGTDGDNTLLMTHSKLTLEELDITKAIEINVETGQKIWFDHTIDFNSDMVIKISPTLEDDDPDTLIIRIPSENISEELKTVSDITPVTFKKVYIYRNTDNQFYMSGVLVDAQYVNYFGSMATEEKKDYVKSVNDIAPDENGNIKLPENVTVTEQTIADWGFTKNKGNYSKPSGGIPASDLAEGVIPEALLLEGGTLTGSLTLSPEGIKTSHANGVETDEYGNIRPKEGNTQSSNFWAVQDSNGNPVFSVQYHTKEVKINGIKVPTIYKGTAAPSASVGSDGDIYIQYKL